MDGITNGSTPYTKKEKNEMTNAYQVPTQILIAQGKISEELYQQDSPENKAALSGIGLTGEKFGGNSLYLFG